MRIVNTGRTSNGHNMYDVKIFIELLIKANMGNLEQMKAALEKEINKRMEQNNILAELKDW